MDELIRLSQGNLARLPPGISVPSYDRALLAPGILHIGVGNFHRAHQSWYLHRLMQDGLAQDWAIVGAGVRDADAKMRSRLAEQDYLTTLIELDPSGTSAEIVGSMVDFVPVEKTNGPLIRALSAPGIRIVAMTVTEGGYYTDPVSNDLDANHPDVRHDAAHPDAPVTAFGAIIAAIRARRDTGSGPISVLSCDNLLGNGDQARKTVVSLASLSDPALADWIERNCSFPNSMVDCIVPATGPAEISLAEGFGLNDTAPVTHENFRQWVIEDKFCSGRPDWDIAGATFSDNVHPYETMKLRLLNAGHQVIANPGEILSIETISGCMTHPEIEAFMRKVLTDEIAHHVAPVPDISTGAYIDLIARRFANPAIVDTTRRVAFDGSSRHTGFVLPVVRDALDAGTPVRGLALVEALWARMCAGVREDGSAIEPNDPFWEHLAPAAVAARDRPAAWLEQGQFYGDLAQDSPFSQAFGHWLSALWAMGCEATLRAYLKE
ncbi:MAG: mannitol dehydrogenase family protein [Pseudomonadota bacterium]